MGSVLPAAEAVVEQAGGTWDASLNLYTKADGHRVCTVQVDEWVYAVGLNQFAVCRYSLGQWIAHEVGEEPQVIEADDAEQAWELLRMLRQDALVWQCGACDGWLFTSGRPRIGVLACSTCGDGGVDFRHADRHVGG